MAISASLLFFSYRIMMPGLLGRGQKDRSRSRLRLYRDAAKPSGLLPFSGDFIGGFECSTQRLLDGRRLDLLQSTEHDLWVDPDYRLLKRHGIATARDGVRWHLIEERPGCYDWSSFLPMLRTARTNDLRVIWDLCHYGWPDDIDIWSDSFIERFASFAAEAARLVSLESDDVPFFCPLNEISFWSWAGGEVGHFAPAVCRGGNDLKRQLVRACIAGITAIRSVVPEARFLHAEPGIHVAPNSPRADDIAAAETYRLAQFEAFDMLSGSRAPELGGNTSMLDVVGINFYPDNQWRHGGGTIPLGHHAYRPLRHLLRETHARYLRPMIIAETGAEGSARSSWLHYVCSEVRSARDAGVPVEAICLYPILDYPGWDNGRHCKTGLFSMADDDGSRATDLEFGEELRRQGKIFDERRALRSDARMATL